jgi:hypothetical protein
MVRSLVLGLTLGLLSAPVAAWAQYDVYDIPVARNAEWSDVYAHQLRVDDEILAVTTLTQIHVFHRPASGEMPEIQVLSPSGVSTNAIYPHQLTAEELVFGSDSSSRAIYYARTGTAAETRFTEMARIAIDGALIPHIADVRGDRMIFTDAFYGGMREGRSFVLVRGGRGECGDGACATGEVCLADCDVGASCGDGRCDPTTEPCRCPLDCGERACWLPDTYVSGGWMECPRLDGDHENWCGWIARFTTDEDLLLGASRRVLTPYHRGVSGWERGAQFGLVGRSPYARYGVDIEVVGDSVAVAAPNESAGGLVDVYQRTGTGYGLTARIPSPVAREGYGFGSDLAFDGRHLVISSGEQESRVYVYELHGTRWALVAVLENEAGYEEISAGSVALAWPAVFASWTEREPHVAPDSFRLRRYTFRCDGDCVELTPAPDAGASGLDAGASGLDAAAVSALDGASDRDASVADAVSGADADLTERVVLACSASPGSSRAPWGWLGAVAGMAMLLARRQASRARLGAAGLAVVLLGVSALPRRTLAQYDVYDIPVTRSAEWTDVYFHLTAVQGDILVVATLTQVHVFHREPGGAVTEIQVLSPAEVSANNVNGLVLTPEELFVGRDRSARVIQYLRTGTGADTRFEERARILVPGATLTGFGIDVRGDRLVLSDPYATNSVYRDGRAFVMRRGGDGTCGDGACALGESCPVDCDASPTCGDGRCDPVTEPCGCPADCGERVCWTADLYASGTFMECPHIDADEEAWCGWTARFTSDDEIVLGANRRVVTPYRRDALGWARGAQFGLTGRTPYARYGIDMGVAGPFLAIGGPNDGGGVVDVHERAAPGDAWALHTRLPSPVATAGYGFGSEVELDATHLVAVSGANDPSPARVYVYELQSNRWVLIAVFDNEAGYDELTNASIALDWPSVFVAWTEREPHVAPDSFRLRRYTFACDGDCLAYVAPTPDAGVAADAAAAPDAGGEPDAAVALDADLDAGQIAPDADLEERVLLACAGRPGERGVGGAGWGALLAIGLLRTRRRR